MFKKFIKSIIFVFILLILAGSVICFSVLYNGYKLYKAAIEKASLTETVEKIRASEDFVPITEVSSDYINAVISIEDNRFYEHIGINLLSTLRAVITNLKNGGLFEGGSSISQQLAKNMYFDEDKRFSRKAAELFVVYELEKEYEKDEILELYINIIYFGDGYDGISRAAMGYFGVLPSELSLSQSTFLAGLPKAPSVYAEHDENAKRRQLEVVEAMFSNGYINKTQADSIKYN